MIDNAKKSEYPFIPYDVGDNKRFQKAANYIVDGEKGKAIAILAEVILELEELKQKYFLDELKYGHSK